MADYIVGDAVTLGATFADSAGTATDPTAVTLQVKDGAGTTTLYTYSLAEITKVSTGVYSKALSLTSSGWWYYEWQGTGTVAKVNNGQFYVDAQLL